MKFPLNITAKDDLTLNTRSWEVSNPKANLLVAHGIYEHSGRYEYEAKYFNQNGFSVFSYDHRGHGKSEGERGYVDNFNELLDDWNQFLNIFSGNDDLPYFVYGHSMGALITVSDACRNQKDYHFLRGMLTTGAALKINKDLSPLLQKISGLLSKITPKLQTIPLDLTVLSHDPEVEIQHKADPLNYKQKTKARMGSELLKQMKFVQTQFEKFEVPFIALHGTGDSLAEADGSIAFYEQAKSSDKELKLYEGLFHEITKELEKDEVLGDMVKWMEDRL